jgi:hypothetical protein
MSCVYLRSAEEEQAPDVSRTEERVVRDHRDRYLQQHGRHGADDLPAWRGRSVRPGRDAVARHGWLGHGPSPAGYGSVGTAEVGDGNGFRNYSARRHTGRTARRTWRDGAARVHGLFLHAAAEDPPQPESSGTPTDTGFLIVACRPVARYVGVSSGEVARLARFCVQVPFRYLLHRLRNPDPCDRRIVRAWLVPPQRRAHCGDIHLQESVPGRRLSKAWPIYQEHNQDQPERIRPVTDDRADDRLGIPARGSSWAKMQRQLAGHQS